MARILLAVGLLLLSSGALAVRPQFAYLSQLEQPGNKNATDALFHQPPNGEKSERPLIGILTQSCHFCPKGLWIAAGFVRWIEAQGARPVPIRHLASDAELRRLFDSVSGIIFPGGLTDLYLDDPYVITARKLFDWAMEENDRGEVFPIWGTCLGHQLQQILVTNVSFVDLLIPTDSVSQRDNLLFTPYAKQSRMFGTMEPTLYSKLGDPAYKIALQNHMYGLPLPHYNRWPVLKDFFHVLSTSVDRQGQEYISSIEAKAYPFFGVQWHPEKPASEFGLDAVPHSQDAIDVGLHLSRVFIHHARQSTHRPRNKVEEIEMLIYNYPPTFTANDAVMEPSYDGPDMTYFIDKEEPVNRTAGARLQAQ